MGVLVKKTSMRIEKKNAVHIMDFPSLRQTYVYDCGANAVQSILTYYGDDMKESEIMEAMGTTPEDGTDYRRILKFFQEKGFKVKARKNLTLELLRKLIELGIPVMLPVQAYRDKPDITYKDDKDDGHWVVAIGYTENAVIFCDPSSVLDTFMTIKELEERWHDEAPQTGEFLEHFGVLIYGKNPFYHEGDIIHMD